MKKPPKALPTLASLALALALPVALCWYYEVYVHWQPKLFPFAVVALLLGCALLTLLTLYSRGERKASALVWKTALSVAVFSGGFLFGVSFLINNVFGREGMAKQAAAVAVPLAAVQVLALFILLRKPKLLICLAASCLLSFTIMIWYITIERLEVYKGGRLRVIFRDGGEVDVQNMKQKAAA